MAAFTENPLLRAASAPLKLVLDILDLAWDQAVEVVGDVYGTAKDWSQRSLGWCWTKVTGVYGLGIAQLESLKSKLSKKDSE